MASAVGYCFNATCSMLVAITRSYIVQQQIPEEHNLLPDLNNYLYIKRKTTGPVLQKDAVTGKEQD